MVTVGRRAYDLMYRFGAPWEGADRVELRRLVRDGRCSAETLRRPDQPTTRAIDLGCGAGGVSIQLAEAGFAVTGVDFSPVALRKARSAARRLGLGSDRVRFVSGDLTAGGIEGVSGPFDLLVDYGTLDDLTADGRRAMARYLTRLARPGARFFLFAFAGRPEDLPRFSFSGPSRAFPGIDDHEVETLFGHAFRIEVIERPTRTRHLGTWLLERREGDMSDEATGNLGASPPVVPASRDGVDVPGQRLAGYALLASAVLAAAGIVFLVGMFTSFGLGAHDTGMLLGLINDTLVLLSYLLAAPAAIVLHQRLRTAWPTLSRPVAVLGLAGIAGIVVFQGLLVTGAMTFEQEIGPASVAFLVLAAWFVATGAMGARSGVLPRGLRLGIAAATYVGYPWWAITLGRRLLAASAPSQVTERAFA